MYIRHIVLHWEWMDLILSGLGLLSKWFTLIKKVDIPRVRSPSAPFPNLCLGGCYLFHQGSPPTITDLCQFFCLAPTLCNKRFLLHFTVYRWHHADVSKSPGTGGKPLIAHYLVTKPTLPTLQTVKRHLMQSVDYFSYWWASSSTRYNDAVSSYTFKMMEKTNLQLKSLLFGLGDPSQSLVSLLFSSLCVTRIVYMKKLLHG